MKKVITTLLSAITIVGVSAPTFAADTKIEKSINFINEIPLLISNYSPKAETNNLIINGKNIDTGELKIAINNGNIMVPLKVTAESLGFKVDIDKYNKIISMDNDEIKTDITVGVDSYYYASSQAIGMTAPEKLGSAPIIIDNEVYVPIKIYNFLFNDSKAIGSFWCETKDGESIYTTNGDLTIGWKLIDNKWYFMNKDGIMQKGWVQSNGNWYYLYDNGQMASNTITPDGYKVDENGKWDFGKEILNVNNNTEEIVETPSPIEEFKNFDEAQKVLNFEIKIPNRIPEQFEVKDISTISREIFQICYSDGEYEILFRCAQRKDDISGNYNQYDSDKIITLDDKKIELKGNNNLVNLALWKVDDISYSISVDNGMNKDTIIDIIKSTF